MKSAMVLTYQASKPTSGGGTNPHAAKHVNPRPVDFNQLAIFFSPPIQLKQAW